MAPIDIVNGGEERTSIGDGKTNANQIEDAEFKEAPYSDERVVLTEKDVSSYSTFLL